MTMNAPDKPSRAMLEKAADDLLRQAHEQGDAHSNEPQRPFTEQQIRRKQRQERDSMNKYICQNDPTLDAMNYLRHRELMLVIKRAKLSKREIKFLHLLFQEKSVTEAGQQLGIKRSCSYQLYQNIVERLRQVWCDAPVAGLASSYCRDIVRRYAKRSVFHNEDQE